MLYVRREMVPTSWLQPKLQSPIPVYLARFTPQPLRSKRLAVAPLPLVVDVAQ